jgi:multisite-specific tRNA:(cytosine-C5)-methyltransferase
MDMVNERFFAYYKAQNIVPEENWSAFLAAIRCHLPTTFRVAGSRQYVNVIRQRATFRLNRGNRTATTLNAAIQEVHVPALSDIEFEGQRIPPPVQLPW